MEHILNYYKPTNYGAYNINLGLYLQAIRSTSEERKTVFLDRDYCKSYFQSPHPSPESKECFLDMEFCQQYFLCPLCGQKNLISKARHRTRETKRMLIDISGNTETYRVTYQNYRICPDCEQSNRNGYIFSTVLWLIVGAMFYTVFSYVYFYTDDLFGTNYILGSLQDRSKWEFFFFFLGLTIFGSWIVWLACYCVCLIWYKTDFFLGTGESLYQATYGNAIAPIEEKDI